MQLAGAELAVLVRRLGLVLAVLAVGAWVLRRPAEPSARVDAVEASDEVMPEAPPTPMAARTVPPSRPLAPGNEPVVEQVVETDVVTGSPSPRAPSLVRYTPKTRAERVDVWLRFAELDVKSQLALQDQLPPEPQGAQVERVQHQLRVVGARPEGTVLWVSEELGYLGTGAQLDEVDPEREGAVRALFVERTPTGEVRVRSSRPLGP